MVPPDTIVTIDMTPSVKTNAVITTIVFNHNHAISKLIATYAPDLRIYTIVTLEKHESCDITYSVDTELIKTLLGITNTPVVVSKMLYDNKSKFFDCLLKSGLANRKQDDYYIHMKMVKK